MQFPCTGNLQFTVHPLVGQVLQTPGHLQSAAVVQVSPSSSPPTHSLLMTSGSHSSSSALPAILSAPSASGVPPSPHLSRLQLPLHPSPLTAFPSSHSSLSGSAKASQSAPCHSRMPSPQTISLHCDEHPAEHCARQNPSGPQRSGSLLQSSPLCAPPAHLLPESHCSLVCSIVSPQRSTLQVSVHPSLLLGMHAILPLDGRHAFPLGQSRYELHRLSGTPSQ